MSDLLSNTRAAVTAAAIVAAALAVPVLTIIASI